MGVQITSVKILKEKKSNIMNSDTSKVNMNYSILKSNLVQPISYPRVLSAATSVVEVLFYRRSIAVLIFLDNAG